ncbi:hypothetical protein [Sulfurovum sp.]|jgi:predicted HAD superfamily hydrolase|uniref:hypothetical protein n=1 Tax=Sulfurovum sp. TaxID=1969726 RepID=UPI002A35A697|nr:hypothetical protein [Sulfurovum sp.]MDY0403614.1 hypothetical protein [Sulfurovum sp.]
MLKVLYWLEPWMELDNPLFRLGSIKNHLQHEFKTLNRSGKIEVSLLTSEMIAKEGKARFDLSNVELFTIKQKDLKNIFNDYHTASLYWFDGRCSNLKINEKMNKLVNKTLGDYKPDVIIVYESAAPFLKSLFPKALILNSMLGMFSREPYPEMGTLDPSGIYKNSYINKVLPDIIENLKLNTEEKENILEIQNYYKNTIIQQTPFDQTIRKNFEKVLLLPLQVSNYFAFSGNVPKNSNISTQYELMIDVLKTIPSNVGVIITQHGAETNVITEKNYPELKKKFPNLIIINDLDKLKWGSQYLLPFIDGVIAVSSSVALQAYFWDKILLSYGDCFKYISDNKGNTDINTLKQCIFEPKSNKEKMKILKFLLFNYNVNMNYHLYDSKWFSNFLEKKYKQFSTLSKKEFLDNFYTNIYEESIGEMKNLYIKSMREKESFENLKNFLSHKHDSKFQNIQTIKEKMNNVDIISFDVFDTLISRQVYHHSHVFKLIEEEANTLLRSFNIEPMIYGGFINIRKKAAKRAHNNAKNKGYEEYTLSEAYRELRLLTGISKEEELKLKKLELEFEKRISTPRKIGQELFQHAVNLNKKIIFTSDMYLEKDFIELLLKKAGYDNKYVSNLFVSSETRTLKKTGNLFSEISSIYSDNLIMHIGDNYYSDYIMAKQKGWEAARILQPFEIFEHNKVHQKLVKTMCISESITYGTIANKFFDNPEAMQKSRFNKNIYNLGYSAGGTIVLGFAKWLTEEFEKDKIEKVYFLARDGKIVKQVYDELKRVNNSLPDSEYLLASRRSYMTPSLFNRDDILNSVKLSFSEDKLDNILKNRFDLDITEVIKQKIINAGFEVNTKINIKKESHLDKFKQLLLNLETEILNTAEKERNELLTYLKEKGLDSKKKIAIVDIGHNGSLQENLQKLLNRKISGYYFMTFEGAKKLSSAGNVLKGYLANFEDNKISYHPYCKNIGMFEFLFLPNEDTFINFNNGKPQFVDLEETKRKELAKDLHKGILDFSIEYLKIINGNMNMINFSANRAIRNYIEFLKQPGRGDASIFKNVFFVDLFGGRAKRYLIDQINYNKITNLNYTNYLQDSWWREGAAALVDDKKVTAKKKINKQGSELTSFQRKLRKLKRDPQLFFKDIKILKKILKYLKGKLS